jgi:hypothetical protein
MADYRLVGDALRDLGGSLRGITQQQSAHQLGLANLGMQQSQQNFQNTMRKGEQDVRIADADRANYESEPITGFQFLDEMKTTPERKQGFKTIIDGFEQAEPGVFSSPLPRKAWATMIHETAMQMNAEKKASAQQAEKMGLERQKIDIAQQQADNAYRLGTERNALERSKMDMGLVGKDNRSTMQKEVEYIAQTKNITPEQALLEWQQSKSEPERIRLYNEEIKALNENMFDTSPEAKAAKDAEVNRLKEIYGIGKIAGNKPQEQSSGVIRMVFDPQTGTLVAK